MTDGRECRQNFADCRVWTAEKTGVGRNGLLIMRHNAIRWNPRFDVLDRTADHSCILAVVYSMLLLIY